MNFLEKLLEGVDVEWKSVNEVTLRTNNIKWKDATRSYQYIDLSSVSVETKKIIETSLIESNNFPSRAQKLVEKDDVIFATTRPTQMRYCLIDEEYDGEVASTGYCVLRAKKEVVFPKWILHLISSSKFKEYLEENQSGIAYPAISDAKLKEFKIPIPCPENSKKSLKIQAEIIKVLDAFSTITAELKAELRVELSMRKKQYNYYRDQLLSFKEDEVEWKSFEKIGEIRRGTAITEKETNPGEIPVVANGPSHNYYHDKSNRSGEIIVIARSGAYAGLVTYWNMPIFLTDAFSLHPDKTVLSTKFLYYVLKKDQIKIHLMGKGAGVPHVRAKDFESYKIPVPSLDEQNRIVGILDKFDTLINSITEGLPKEIKLRQQQYEYYRDLLFSFPKPEVVEV